MEINGIFIILGTIFCFGMVAWFITLIIDFIRPKSNQFTMSNPPEPPKTQNEKYIELELERIELVAKLKAVDLKMKAILKNQESKNSNSMFGDYKSGLSNILPNLTKS